MSTDPIAFVQNDIPALFNRGVAQYKERADSGDEQAKARYADIAAARGAIRVVIEGAGEVWLGLTEGTLEALDSRPDLPIRFAIGAPADAAAAGLEELASSELLEREEAPRRLARSASAELEKMLEGHRLEFHLTLKDLPADPDEVTIKIGIGVDTPPETPKFKATVSWDDIEDLQAGELTPQQLFGRLKLEGDASQAMALGMALMQRRQAR